jgi:hypothetical protein
MATRTPTRTRVTIVLLVSLASAVGFLRPPEGTAAEIADRQKAYREYLSKFDNAKATVQLKEVMRLPEGRVQETIYKGDWKARNGEHRVSYYLEKTVDGKKEVYQIRDALIGRELAVVWYHAGFPGEVHFGKKATRGGGELAFEARNFAGALEIPTGLRRWFDEPAARVEPVPGGDEVLVVPTPVGDPMEIYLSKRHGFLPERIRRPGVSKVVKKVLDGWGIDIEYAPGPDGTPLPKRIVRNEPLAPGEVGMLLWEWVFTGFELNPAYSEDETKLFIPNTANVKNADTNEVFRLDEDSKKAKEFRDQLPESVKVVSQSKAVVELAKTAAGKAPYYPKGFFNVTLEEDETAAAASSEAGRKRWRYWAIGGVLGTLLLAATVWVIRRDQGKATGAPAGSAAGASATSSSSNRAGGLA